MATGATDGIRTLTVTVGRFYVHEQADTEHLIPNVMTVERGEQ